jgi:hypothetical protein
MDSRSRGTKSFGWAKRSGPTVQENIAMVGTLRFAHPTASGHASTSSRLDLPEFCIIIVPPKNRGRRECRVFVAPAALRAGKKARKQVTTGTPKLSGIPCTTVYGL